MRSRIVPLFGFICVLSLGANAWGQAHFLRGDSNDDGSIDISDGISTLGYLFLGSSSPVCQDAADVNDSGEVDIADAIYTFGFLFGGGSPPAAPYPVFEADPTVDAIGCKDVVDVTADVTSDTLWTSDKCYRLDAAVFVKTGSKLTIQDGTTVIGRASSAASKPVLVVERGAQIEAVGTETRPVVFTTEALVGARAQGQWGGIIILGRGTLNLPGGTGNAEGLTDVSYGGGATPDDNESSGRLSYVRIEYGGFPISPNNEVNGLSLFAVGRGTQLDHIQVKFNDDDGIEWFGGAANLKYGLVSYISDDMFDYSYGWQGKGQFWVGIEKENAGSASYPDHGMEVDNSETEAGGTFADTPFTRPTISNVTLLGTGVNDGGEGFRLRRGAGTRLYNLTIQGFNKPGFNIDDDQTCINNAADGWIALKHAVFFDNGSDGNTHWTAADSSLSCNSQQYVQDATNIIATSAPTGLTVPYDLLNPDFRPVGDALTSPFDTTTLGDSFFEPAPYRGGVAPSIDWTKAPWVSYAQN